MMRTGKRAPQAGASEEAGATTSLKPTLYIDIVGTLVLQEGASFRVVPFAREFIRLLSERFQMVFLSELSEPAALEIARFLDASIEFGIWRKGLGKVSGIDFSRSFLWIDDAPTSRDLMRLAEERCSDRLITVNGKDGVTRTTLNKVEALVAALL